MENAHMHTHTHKVQIHMQTHIHTHPCRHPPPPPRLPYGEMGDISKAKIIKLYIVYLFITWHCVILKSCLKG